MNKKGLFFFLYLVLVLVLFTAVSHSQTHNAPPVTAADLPILDKFVYLPIIINPIPSAKIDFFTANVTIADPGERIWLSWQTENATAVTLYHLMPTGQLGQFWNVSATGTMSYTIPTSTRNNERFMLYANNDETTAVNAPLTLPLTCPNVWFFAPAPNICPQNAPLDSPSAEQQFERGWMIWVAVEERIYILYNDEQFSPKWQIYTDEWKVGIPEDDPTIMPPAGFYQPQRGFGLVWREQATVRERLGWAIVNESSFVTAVQRTSYAKYNETYIRAQDDNIWKLLPEQSGWEKFSNLAP